MSFRRGLAVLRAVLGPESAPGAVAGWAGDRALVEWADREGVLGLLARAAGMPLDSELGPRLLGSFESGARKQAYLTALGRRLERDGLEAIVLKGAGLAPSVYGGHLSSRPISDIDLLLRTGQSGAVSAVLRELSGQGRSEIVDLHADLLGSARIPMRAALLRLSEEEVWSLSRPWQPGLRILLPELQFLHLALHGLKHSCSRLIWLVDLVLVLPTCDPERLLSLARKAGCTQALAFQLELLRRLFGQPLPLSLDLPTRWWEEPFLWLAQTRRQVPWGEVYLAMTLPGWKRRLTYLWQLAALPGPGTRVGRVLQGRSSLGGA